MQRLLKSSKFWALVAGLIMLVAVATFGQGTVQEWAGKLSVWLAFIAPVVYAIMTGLEDALSDGVLSVDEIINLIKQVLDEWLAEDEPVE